MDDKKVSLVLPRFSRGGILEKFALRLGEHLPSLGFEPVISDQPLPEAAINHWLIYHNVGGKYQRGSFMITHVDSFWRLRMVRKALHTTDFGICLSKDTLNFLAEKGVPAQQLRAITPGYDGDIKPRRVVIGLTTHLYPNKCKREDVLLEVCQKRRLDDFRFVIFGNGWEPVLPVLLDAGAEVEHTPGTQDYLADYQKIKAAVPFFDYYLYMGLDEGSMGILVELQILSGMLAS
jgi:hypothetical protein